MPELMTCPAEPTSNAPPDVSRLATDEVLRDGGSIHIRAIRPDDKQRLLEHFRHLGPMSVNLRFCGAKKSLSDEELRWFTELDFVSHVGLVATLREREVERIIGVGRYIAIPESGTSPQRAEVAFAVLDEHQGRGIGTLLLEHLAPIARANGITAFEAEMLGENNRMLEVFAAAGFVVRSSIRAGTIHISFPTDPFGTL